MAAHHTDNQSVCEMYDKYIKIMKIPSKMVKFTIDIPQSQNVY